jgi:hypothetical protein
MAEFSELIKNFNKIRDFMRDFYIYKSRDDFSMKTAVASDDEQPNTPQSGKNVLKAKKKSARTYDNEKRRCESYLGENMKWTYSGGSKVLFVSLDSGKTPSNPLFSAWKSKSFTKNDILLHFYILDALQKKSKPAEELTEEISLRSGTLFDLQTVRGKCNEYTDLGILTKTKKGKAFFYKISQSPVTIDEEVLDAVKFFQSGTLGVIGSYILDNENVKNDLFVFKHHYIAHTLEDGIVFDILSAIRENKQLSLTLVGSKSGQTVLSKVCPINILYSLSTGRRYLCAYTCASKRFTTYRLDAVKSVETLEETISETEEIRDAFSRNIGKVWGVSFDGEARSENFSMTLHIDEKREQYVVDRLRREGRGGTLEKIDENTFLFRHHMFDANEASPWIKTFIGRIKSVETNSRLKRKLESDIRRMAEMYGIAYGTEKSEASTEAAEEGGEE